jgi:lipopolysaccharide transport system permease protein
MARTIVTPPQGIGLPRWREMWEAREVMWRFGVRDVVLRYRQTVVGVAWVILQPLAAAGIFSIVFGKVAQLPSAGIPYFIFSFAGMLAWDLVAGIVTRAAPSLVANQSLVAKVFFPRLLVPLSTTIAVMLDFLVGLAFLVVMLFIFGIGIGWSFLLVPVWVVLAVMIASGIGVAASALMVRYRDVAYVTPWLMQLLFFATPVAYSMEAVPDNLRVLFAANPFTWLMEAFRWSLLGLDAPPTWQMFGLAGFAVLVLSLGLVIYQRFEREFADVI